MLNHPDRNISIYNIPTVAYPLAMTSATIQAGFKRIDIFYFNKEIFMNFASS